jgi:hypothetical protein
MPGTWTPGDLPLAESLRMLIDSLHFVLLIYKRKKKKEFLSLHFVIYFHLIQVTGRARETPKDPFQLPNSTPSQFCSALPINTKRTIVNKVSTEARKLTKRSSWILLPPYLQDHKKRFRGGC